VTSRGKSQYFEFGRLQQYHSNPIKGTEISLERHLSLSKLAWISG